MRRSLLQRATSLALSWVFTATSVWGVAPPAAAAPTDPVHPTGPVAPVAHASPVANHPSPTAAATSPGEAQSASHGSSRGGHGSVRGRHPYPSSGRHRHCGQGHGHPRPPATSCLDPFWGPRRFTRTAGAPNQYSEEVALPASLRPPFTLRIVNGEPDGRRRVSSARITVDGVVVASPSDFSQTVASLERQVSLANPASIGVWLASAPHSFLTLSLCGTTGDGTSPELAWTAPVHGGVISDATPALALAYSDPQGTDEPPASGVDPGTLEVFLDEVDRTEWFTAREADATAVVPEDLSLTEGPHRLVARIDDRAGNHDEAVAEFVVDLTPPQLGILEPLAGAYLRPPVSARASFADAIGLDEASLRVLLNGEDRTAVFSRQPGSASASLDAGAGLIEGPNRLELEVRDLAGHASTRAVVFNVDTTPPQIDVEEPQDGSLLPAGTARVALRCLDAQALDPQSVEARLDGALLVLSGDGSSFTASTGPLADGPHTLVVSASDRAGNPATATSRFRVDATRPAIRVVEPPSGSVVREVRPQIGIEWEDDGGIDTPSLKVEVNGVDRTAEFQVAGQTARAQLAEPLPQGRNTILASIADLAGHLGEGRGEFVIDSEPPLVELLAPQALVRDNRPAVEIAWSDATTSVVPASASIRIDGEDRTALFAVDQGRALGALTLDPPLADGDHEIAVTVADEAGNQASASFRFRVDSTPPDLAIESPRHEGAVATGQPGLRLAWSDQTSQVDLASLRLFLGPPGGPEVEIPAPVEPGVGGLEGVLGAAGPLADGTWVLRVLIADAAGNPAERSAVFVVDTVAPTFVVETPAAGAALPTLAPAFDILVNDDRSGIDTQRSKLLVDGVDRTERVVWEEGRARGALVLEDGLGQGRHSLELQLFDRAGNRATPVEHHFTLDTVAPGVAVELPPAGAFVGALPELRLSYQDAGDQASGIELESVVVEVDGIDHSGALDRQPGTAVGRLTEPLADGPHVVVARVRDLAGNPSTATSSFTVDTRPPSLAEISLEDGAFVAELDAEGRLVLTGRLEDLDARLSLECVVGGQSVAASFQGSSFTCAVPLAEGTHSITLRATDGSGHRSEATRTVNVDTTPPALYVLAPEEGGYTNAESVSVSGTVLDASPVTVLVEGAAAVVAGQSFAAAGVPLGAGPSQTLTVTATDAARNTTTRTVEVRIDRDPPRVRITRPLPGEALPVQSIRVEGSFEDASPVSMVYVGDQPAEVSGSGGRGTFVALLNLVDGAAEIEARAHDAAGNFGIDRVPIRVDTTAPLLIVSEPVSPVVTRAASVRVAGTVADVGRVSVSVGEQVAAAAPDGSFALEVPLPAQDGSLTLTVRASDDAGNTSEQMLEVTVDRTPPAIEVASPEEGAVLLALPVVVQGVVRDLTTVALTIDSRPIALTGTAWSGSFDGLVDGPHTFEIVATDAAGNSSRRDLSVRIDLAPPVLYVSGPASGSATRESRVNVLGTVSPLPASVAVNGVAALVDEAGNFTAQVELAEGDNSLRVVARRPGSSRIAEQTILVTSDRTPPVIQLTAPEVLARDKAARAVAAVTDNLVVASVELRLGESLLGIFDAPPYEAALVLPAGARSGDSLPLSVIATDAAGNSATLVRNLRVIASGIAIGLVRDAATGLPLPEAVVEILSGAGGTTSSSDAEGRFTTPVDDARVVVRVCQDGRTCVDRQGEVATGVGNVLVDARLTRLAEPAVVGPTGGRLEAGDLALVVPPLALAGEAGVRLTALSPQALPGLLPLGFSPLAAFDLRFTEPTTPAQPLLVEAAGLPQAEVHLVGYRESTHGWVMLARGLAVDEGRAQAEVPQAGAYALVIADEGEPLVALVEPGQELTGVPAVALPAEAASEGEVTPATLPPSGGTAEGRLVLRADAPLPSGTVVAVQATETYQLVSGDTASSEPQLSDVILYRTPAPAGAALAASFPITPARRYDDAELVEGRVHLDVLAGREAVRGRAGGNDALTLEDAGLAVSIAAGSLARDTAISFEASGLSAFLPQVEGLTALREAVLDLAGARLATSAELRMEAAGVPAGGTLLVARVERIEGVPVLSLIGLAERVGDRLVSRAHPGLPGVREGGRYLFLRLASPIGFVGGIVSAAGAPAVVRVSAVGLPFVQLGLTGERYLAAAPTGTATISARRLDGSAAATGTVEVAEMATASLDLPLAAVAAPAEVTPADGAAGVAISTQIQIDAVLALDPASVSADAVRLAKGAEPVAVRLLLSSSGRRLAIVPLASLEPATRYTVTASGLRTITGSAVSVPATSFTTRAAAATGFDTRALRFSFPQDGLVRITADAGSLPAAAQILVINAGNGVVASFSVRGDGSVEEQIEAGLDDLLMVSLTDSTGNVTSWTTSQFVASDGTTSVGPGGGIVDGPGGLQLRVPEGAASKGVTLRLEPVDPADIPDEERPDFLTDENGQPLTHLGAAVRISSPQAPAFAKEVDIAFPVPAAAPEGAFYYVVRRLDGPDGRIAFETLDTAFLEGEGEQARVVTASPPFPGFRRFAGAFDASGASLQQHWSLVSLLWSDNPVAPRTPVLGVITGKVLRAKWAAAGTTVEYEPAPAGTVVTLLGADDQPVYQAGRALVATVGEDGTYALFTQRGAASMQRVSAVLDGERRTATVYDAPVESRPTALHPFGDVRTASIVFPAAAPPPLPPKLRILLMEEPTPGQRRLVSGGLVLSESPLLIGFLLDGAQLMGQPTVNGQPQQPRPDDRAPDEPLAVQQVVEFTPQTAGVYAVSATAQAAFGAPVTVRHTFRVIAGGGSHGEPGAPGNPQVISSLTAPQPFAEQVALDVFPQVTFSEPVRNVPASVQLLSLPSEEPLPVILSGVGIDEEGRPIALTAVDDPQVALSTVTLQPRGGLLHGTRYRIRVLGGPEGVLDLDRDAEGNETPHGLEQPYDADFTTFALSVLPPSARSDSFSSPAVVQLGTNLFAIENRFTYGVLRAFDVSDPLDVRPVDTTPDVALLNRPIDLSGEGETLVLASGPAATSRPSNLWVLDVSRLPRVPLLGAVGLTNSAVDGFVNRVDVRDGFAYAATFRKGVQMVDLARARDNLARARETYSSSVGGAPSAGYVPPQLIQDGGQFGPDAIVTATPVNNGERPAYLRDLQVFDGVVTGRSFTLVAAAGDVGLTIVDPRAGREVSRPELSDGQSTLQDGLALAVGVVDNRTTGVVAGIGEVADEEGDARRAYLLATVDLSDAATPRPLGFVELPEEPVDVVLQGDQVAVSSASRTRIVKLADVSRPTLSGQPLEGLGGSLAFDPASGALFGVARSTFGQPVAQGETLRAAILDPGAACTLLRVPRPEVAMSLVRDPLNGTLCGKPGVLEIGLCRTAAVTVSVGASTLVASVDGGPPQRLSGLVLPAGMHTIEVPLHAVDEGRSGRKSFRVEAVDPQDPAQTQQVTGEIVPDLVNRSVLPVGHTFVKGVDLLDGHLVQQSTDLRLPGRHLSLELSRTYSSAGASFEGELGAGWSSNLGSRVTPSDCGLYAVSTPDGASQTFRILPNGEFRPQRGYHARLQRAAAGGFDFFDKAGKLYRFSALADPRKPDGPWRLDFIRDPHGDELRFSYDAESRVTKVTEWQPERGSVRSLSFRWAQVASAFRLRSVESDASLGLRVEYEYDAKGNLRSVRRPGVNVAGQPSSAPRMEYYSYTVDDPRDPHQLLSATDPNGSRTEYVYYGENDHFPGETVEPSAYGVHVLDKLEHVKEVHEFPGGTEELVTRFAYDYSEALDLTLRCTVTDARGQQTLYTMNGWGSPTRIEEPLGKVTRMEWAADDIYKTAETDALGRRTTYGYDERGNLTRETVETADFGEVVTTWSYEPRFNKLTSKTDAENRTTTYAIDPDTGDLLSSTDAAGNLTRYSYDDHGQLLQVTSPRGHASSHSDHDSFGNARAVVDPLGNLTRRLYDARGRQIRQCDSSGRRTDTAYDGFDRPVSEVRFASRQDPSRCQQDTPPVGPGDAETVTQYYAGGQPRSVKNALGAVTSFALDGMNRVIGTTTRLPGGGLLETSASYDGNGNKIRETDRRGVTRELTYDELNRLVAVSILPDGTEGPTGVVSRTAYDLVGNKVADTNLAGDTTRYELDGLYRVVRRVLPQTAPGGQPYVEAASFDRVGNRLSLTDPNGHTSSWAYDALGRVVTTRNALGQESFATYDDPEGSHVNRSEDRDPVRGLRTRYSYDALNREVSRQVRLEGVGGDGVVYTTATAYDDHGHTVTVTDPRGVRTETTLDGLDRATAVVVDEAGLALRSETAWDGLGNKVRQTDPRGNTTTFRYDGLGRQVAMIDAQGQTATAQYDGEGLKIAETDRVGVVTRYTWDTLGRARTSVTLPSLSGVGWRHETIYQDRAHRRVETDARGAETVFETDRLGRVIRQIDARGGVAETTWDGVQKTAERNRRGHTTRFEYDALGRLTATVDALGRRSETAYDDASNRRTETDRRGHRTRTQLDPLGRVLRITRAFDPDTGRGVDVETNTWDPVGSRLLKVDAEGHATRYAYDGAGRLVRRIDGADSATASQVVFQYDEAGNLTVEIDERHSAEAPTVRNGYDELNRLVWTKDGEGNETRHAYDAEGRRVRTTTPRGHTTAFEYEEKGKLLAVRQPGERVTRYAYDPNRNLVRLTDAREQVVERTYDELDRQVSAVQDAQAGGLGLVTLFEYDPNGNETLRVDPKGGRVTSTWDVLDRPETRAWTAAPGEEGLAWRSTSAIRYEHDANGNLVKVDEEVASGTDPPVTLTTSRTWDDQDRLESETTTLPDSGPATVRYTYYGNGTRKSVSDPAGVVTNYTYDAQDRLASAVTASGETRYAYYPDDLLREVSYPNGVVARHGYDLANRLVSLTNTRPGGQVVSSYLYSYDADGNRLSQTETNGGRTEQTSYGYDELSRLVRVTYPVDAAYPQGRVVSYGYDPVGNRERETERDGQGLLLSDRQGVFDSLNRLVSLTDLARDESDPERVTSFGWDPNGNQTSKTTGALTTSYLYDARDKLVEVQQGPSILSRFQYDFQGRRNKKIGEEGLRQYVYDQTSLLAEYDENGALRAKYDYGSDRLISLTRTDEGRRYFSLDGLRSVVNLTDDAGATVASYHLDPWGNFRFPAQLDASRNRFAFTGHVYEPEIGLYNAKARYFDPKLGRFLTQDSYLGQNDEPPSLHRYFYAHANPVRFVDPTGHQAVDPNAPPDDVVSGEEILRRASEPIGDPAAPWAQARSSDTPEGEVKEEGWAGKILRDIAGEPRRQSRRYGEDVGEALTRDLVKPKKRVDPFNEQQISALDYDPRTNIAEQFDETITDVGRELGGQAGEALHDYAAGRGAAVGAVKIVGQGRTVLKSVARNADEAVAVEVSASRQAAAGARVAGAPSSAGKPLVGTQKPSTAWAAKTGRAYDRRVARFWRRYEGQTVGDWTIESANRRLAPGVQPDVVFVNESTKTIVVHDATSKMAGSHLAKGARYQKFFEAQRPGYTVRYSEGYWKGLENSWEALSQSGELYFPGLTKPPGTQ